MIDDNFQNILFMKNDFYNNNKILVMGGQLDEEEKGDGEDRKQNMGIITHHTC